MRARLPLAALLAFATPAAAHEDRVHEFLGNAPADSEKFRDMLQKARRYRCTYDRVGPRECNESDIAWMDAEADQGDPKPRYEKPHTRFGSNHAEFFMPPWDYPLRTWRSERAEALLQEAIRECLGHGHSDEACGGVEPQP